MGSTSYDQLSVVTEADQANSTVNKYDYGMDQLVRLSNQSEGRSFFHLDGLRSTVSLTDTTGGSHQSILYDAWGNERDRVGTSANNFTFTGHELDVETGLMYAKARFYDPDIGRFLNQDTFLGDVSNAPSLHRYLYAYANPTRFVDPTGHAAGDLWDPRTYFGSPDARAGAWQGLKEAYFENAADIGDSLGAFANGVGKGGWGLVTGTVGLTVGATNLQAQAVTGAAEYLATGNAERLFDVNSEIQSGSQAAWREIKSTAMLTKEGYANPMLALDAATELGIEGASEVLGGATFDTALLVAPTAKGARVAAIAHEGRSATVLSAVQESRAVRAAMEKGGGFQRYVEAERAALSTESRAAGQGATIAQSSGSPAQLTSGVAWEEAQLASLGKLKNTQVWRPSVEDIKSAAFEVIVGEPKYTKGGLPKGTIYDVSEGGFIEFKGGTSPLGSSYQLRLQTYRALKAMQSYTIQTTRPVKPTFYDWLKRWGVKVERPTAAQ